MAAANVERKFDFVVVGGGIAGVSCTEYLSTLNGEKNICLISGTDLVKSVSNVKKLSQTLEEYDVTEQPLHALVRRNVTVVKATVVNFNPEAHKVMTSDGKEYVYKKLCICTGARPKLISEENEHVIGLRDLQSVEYFQKRLSTAKRVVIVGNGGIALELAYELQGCAVVWVIKDDTIGNAYFDKGAAHFFLASTSKHYVSFESKTKLTKMLPQDKLCNSSVPMSSGEGSMYAAALGQSWKDDLNMGSDEVCRKNVIVEYSTEVKALLNCEQFKDLNNGENDKNNWNIFVKLSNGKIYGCDFLVSATGVLPNTEPFTKHSDLKIADDGGIIVDKCMRTNLNDVFAAGDVCNASWEHSEYWFQMRLWTQANQMGAYAAKCMISDLEETENFMDFCFEMFAHVTSFFGFKVILLGKYNGQGLGSDYEALLRCTMGREYVKVVLHEGRVHGALLIGETELEETLENLILNQMDVSQFGEDLLNPDIDIDDFFD